ncbi:TonB-dependent receptor [Acidicapsa ligni]|uniref:TonB-dependent receptor n=1 Tax=Acidicapsa ligni TaxID=542300 RepID=UPI0021E0AB17|nr:TonB-dependent receptor [Acidicapsa ligni]
MLYFEISSRQIASWMLLLLLLCNHSSTAFADASSASLSITVADPSGAVISSATAILRNSDTNQEQRSVSGKSGTANFPFLKPGRYTLTVSKDGFSDVTVNGILLDVGDDKHLQLVLKVGAANQTVTVNGGGLNINTTDGAVSTVIDRQFVANIPLNGRSFQDLISMTPGVATQSPQDNSLSPGNTGDFSINGQRTESNYYMVDGVSGNVTAGASAGNGLIAGTVAATSALGTTQSLLSVDALQEFRVESSSYSAEYGRSPGGQLSFVTRSGTNALHGSAFDYFRNGSLDANNWFNDSLGEPKNELHQNDFGGTLGGPIWIPSVYKGLNKTFFFGSYEGLRMTEPVAASIQYVPDLYLREQAPAALQPILNAYPLPSPNGVDYGTAQSPSLAQFFQGYSVPGKIDSTSIRVDHNFSSALSGFFRFADTPSSTQSRSLSALTTGQVNIQTYTLGLTYVLTPTVTNQFRLGYSRSFSGSTSTVDAFGGATPIDLGKAMGITSGTTGQDLAPEMYLYFPSAGSSVLKIPAGLAQQHQWNLTDTFEVSRAKQHLKFGVDFRTFTTLQAFSPIEAAGVFESAQSVLSNVATETEYLLFARSEPVFNQVALFAQDDWRLNSKLSVSAGLRWEFAPPPHNALSPQPYTATGSLADPSSLELAPAGTPMWHNSWFNFAPRLGLAWQAHSAEDWMTVIRTGGGVFFDTNNEIADSGFSGLGTFAEGIYPSSPLPFTASQQDIGFAVAPPYSDFTIFPAHFQLPYTLEWNASIEQELGKGSSATISYVGSAGRRLNASQELNLSTVNPSFGSGIFYPFSVTSDYDALQTKFQRSISHGINAIVSYTWSHSIDFGSNFSALPVTRGNSDFDLRNNLQAGFTWEPAKIKSSALVSSALNGWSLDGRLLARTSFPITLQGNLSTDPATGSEYFTNLNLVPDQPIYLHSKQYPGGRALNPAAFAYPAGADPGNAPRNFARGFGASQVNFALAREFRLSERARLHFRGEAFNLSNHPNFGYIDPYLGDPTFGEALQTLNQSLGTVASQYQQGGPRSMQFALRLSF